MNHDLTHTSVMTNDLETRCHHVRRDSLQLWLPWTAKPCLHPITGNAAFDTAIIGGGSEVSFALSLRC